MLSPLSDTNEVALFLKDVMKSCGLKEQTCLLMVSPEDLVHDDVLEHVSALVKIGHIPSLWGPEERESMVEEVKLGYVGGSALGSASGVGVDACPPMSSAASPRACALGSHPQPALLPCRHRIDPCSPHAAALCRCVRFTMGEGRRSRQQMARSCHAEVCPHRAAR